MMCVENSTKQGAHFRNLILLPETVTGVGNEIVRHYCTNTCIGCVLSLRGNPRFGPLPMEVFLFTDVNPGNVAP